MWSDAFGRYTDGYDNALTFNKGSAGSGRESRIFPILAITPTVLGCK